MLNANRYKYLIDYLANNSCNNILEIGTNRGYTAIEMLKSSCNKNINYYGIDLFEDMTSEIFKKEISVETHNSRRVKAELDAVRIGKIYLYKGFSKDILPQFVHTTRFDLIFVDGGHSYDTVTTDLLYSLNLVTPNGVIFIDDYSDEIPDVKKAIDELSCKMKKEILIDYFDTYRGHNYYMVKLS